MEQSERKQKVVVVGAGPVGSLAALYAATRGDEVEIYDLRGDMRDTSTTPLNFTKSINLALSERGINAMRQSGSSTLLENVLAETIPMHGRMIHGSDKKGELYEASQAYDVHGRFQRSVDRGGLNKRLLDELEKLPNVKLFFNHKLTGADFRKKIAWFEQRKVPSSNDSGRANEIEVSFSLMIGADGAHSAARHHMMKFARMNYQQEYIDTLWCEFQIAPSKDNDFRIPPNYLHIWPAGDFMFIALPSLDKTFTCTLFAPSALFAKVEADPDTELLELFEHHFPGVSPDLISPDDLKSQFKQNPHLPLINIKCTPHHFGSSVVILGDAANAVVPFYGQGMNAGLESVRILFDQLDRSGVYSPHPHDANIALETARAAALDAYTAFRTPDTLAIADLALRNYDEMKSHVVSPLYKLRKAVEESLDRYFPQLGWATQYSRVSFSNLRYSEVDAMAARQGKVLKLMLFLLVGLGVGGSGLWLSRLLARRQGGGILVYVRQVIGRLRS